MDDCVYQYIARRIVSEDLVSKGHSVYNLEEANEYAYKKGFTKEPYAVITTEELFSPDYYDDEATKKKKAKQKKKVDQLEAQIKVLKDETALYMKMTTLMRQILYLTTIKIEQKEKTVKKITLRDDPIENRSFQRR